MADDELREALARIEGRLAAIEARERAPRSIGQMAAEARSLMREGYRRAEEERRGEVEGGDNE